MAADWLAQQAKQGMDSDEWADRPTSSFVGILSRDGFPAAH
ncbi:putative ribonuclease H protein [Corchorus olitorius]|uniref:Ribonuclease H protein n=1 Tax=Corchorus olitorius TaxID=93759 RepID=A0A1R3K4U2_9ROSI|nr:putative ribonuclease H protein [Corchorus olitorius]